VSLSTFNHRNEGEIKTISNHTNDFNCLLKQDFTELYQKLNILVKRRSCMLPFVFNYSSSSPQLLAANTVNECGRFVFLFTVSFENAEIFERLLTYMTFETIIKWQFIRISFVQLKILFYFIKWQHTRRQRTGSFYTSFAHLSSHQSTPKNYHPFLQLEV